MKKVLLSLAAMAMMGMMMTSCQKDEGLSKDTFTATTENGNSKTHLDGLNLKWDDEGESIMVMGDNSMAEYFATSVTNDNTCATFACQEGSEVTATSYHIYYPASMIAVTAANPQLPATQEYVAGNVKGFPMYAETQSHAFQFTNLCGLFRMQLQKTGKSISSITITTDKAVNGAFDVSTSAAGAFQLEAYTTEDNTQKSVILDCGENGVSIDNLTEFNIYLPVGTYSTFDITITATDGSQCVKGLNAGSSLTINRNERVTLTREGEELEFVAVTSSAPEDAIDGLFTVNARGKQVYFAKGNLQYVNGQWRFAEHQYDYLGSFYTYNYAWDLFGWSTAATNFGKSTSINSSDYSGSFVDWGTQIGDGETWYTLSNAEWNYVLNMRTRAASKRGLATVNGIHGLILLPDTWTPPVGLSFTSGTGRWTLNQYGAARWEQMEAAGAVFLPAAGYRYGTGMSVVGTSGSYWSSTPHYGYYAYNIYFYEYCGYNNNNNYRELGYSVRLVQDYQNN